DPTEQQGRSPRLVHPPLDGASLQVGVDLRLDRHQPTLPLEVGDAFAQRAIAHVDPWLPRRSSRFRGSVGLCTCQGGGIDPPQPPLLKGGSFDGGLGPTALLVQTPPLPNSPPLEGGVGGVNSAQPMHNSPENRPNSVEPRGPLAKA